MLISAVACGVVFDAAPPTGGGGGSTGMGANAGARGDGGSVAAPSTAATGAAGSGMSGGGSGGNGSGGNGQGGSAGGAGGTGGVDLGCPSPNTVCCGNGACPLPSMECCATSQSQTQASVCVPAGTCPANELPIRCDDSEDCGGDICCATWNGSSHVVIACEPSCPVPSTLGNSGTYPMCSYPGGNCPSGMSCFDDCCVGDLGIGYCY